LYLKPSKVQTFFGNVKRYQKSFSAYLSVLHTVLLYNISSQILSRKQRTYVVSVKNVVNVMTKQVVVFIE